MSQLLPEILLLFDFFPYDHTYLYKLIAVFLIVDVATKRDSGAETIICIGLVFLLIRVSHTSEQI